MDQLVMEAAKLTDTFWMHWVTNTSVPYLPLSPRDAKHVLRNMLGSNTRQLPLPQYEVNLGKVGSFTLWLANCTGDLYWAAGLYPWGKKPYVLKLV